MPTAIREQCYAALLAAVKTAMPAVDVERNRSGEIPENKDKFVVITDGEQTKASDEEGVDFFTTSPELELWVREKTDDLLGPALNKLYGDVIVALFVDYTLGGVAVDVRENELSDPTIDTEAKKPTMGILLSIDIDYMTKKDDPFTIGP